MGLEIQLLDLGDNKLESSFLVAARELGQEVAVPTNGYLIEGGEEPILVDTGYRDPDSMQRLGMQGYQPPEMELETQLGKHGYDLADIGWILHTHMHIDHGGQDDKFPMSTTVALNRREMEYSVAGIMGKQYPPEDVKHLVDRLHEDKALALLDLDEGPETIIPGVTCHDAGGHTEGSMNVHVETDEGTAVICGDVIYNIHDQVVEPHPPGNSNRVGVKEPTPTGNHGTSSRAEKTAMKNVLYSGDFVLPMHDRPARVNERGEVVSRLYDEVPGKEYDPEEISQPEFMFGPSSTLVEDPGPP
jgi:glyoxylase-like metal-dependent hydrolase (beta-lactamase superfamily II)